MGQLTTHILDISAGLPAEGVRIELHEHFSGGLRLLATTTTGPDGRAPTPSSSSETAYDTGLPLVGRVPRQKA